MTVGEVAAASGAPRGEVLLANGTSRVEVTARSRWCAATRERSIASRTSGAPDPLKPNRLALLSFAATAACSTAGPRRAAGPADVPSPPLADAPVVVAAAGSRPLDAETLATRSSFAAPFASEPDKSYLIPAVEIVSLELLLTQFNRHFIDEDEYGSDRSSISRNLHTGWVIDDDPFDINQLWHPFAGSLYYGFARSAGLGFWGSAGYTFLGSALWEVAGETVPPSLNDQVSTAIGGTFIGESFFRTAHWILAGEREPDAWREVAAAVVSPPTCLNRHAFGDRFRTPFDSGDPAVFARVGIGGSLLTRTSDRGSTDEVDRYHVVGNFEIDYGLPGRRSDRWDEPFDYFHMEGSFTSNSDAFVEDAFIRGLLWGGEYGSSPVHGLVGVYGTYCYMSPALFQLSTTALSFGTTMQWWCTEDVAVQGNALGGVGYGAAGRTTDSDIENDYHYGITPQAILGLRIDFADVAMVDLSARDYYVTGSGSSDNGRSENILRAQSSLTFRIHERHAVGIEYDLSLRHVPDAASVGRNQSVQTTRLVYSYLLGNTHSRLSGVK
jgi:hypothetical protein